MKPHTSLFLAGALLVGSVDVHAATSYVGTWQNSTFGASGAATFVLDFVNDDWTAIIDLDGNVFGGLDPAPLELGGTFSGFGSSDFSVDDHPTYGDVSGSISGGTLVSASLVDLPNPAIAGVEISGCVGGGSLECVNGEISLSYVVTFNTGFGLPESAEGVIVATPVVVPVPAAAWLLGVPLAMVMRRQRQGASVGGTR